MERKEAKLLGLHKYETGRPCMNNHITFRYTSTGSCNHCLNGVRSGKKPESLIAKANALRISALTIYNDAMKVINDNYERAMKTADDYDQQAANLKLELDVESETENQKLFDFRDKLETKKLVKSMIKQKVFIHPDDVFEAKTYLLERAQSVCPSITMDDVNYKRKVQGGVLHEIRCFPQHQQEIIEATTKAYNARTIPLSSD